MKNKLVWHQIVLLGIVVVLSLLKIISGNMSLGLSMLWWWLGAVIGFLLVFGDRLVHVILMKEEPLSRKIADLFGKGRYIQTAESLVAERHEQKELVMRSALFVIVWIVLAVFTVTSASNTFARGFVLGVGIHLFFDLITDYRWNRERFDLWFWQIKRELPEQEKRIFVWVGTVLFAALAVLF